MTFSATRLSVEDNGPVALRPQVTLGLPFSKAYLHRDKAKMMPQRKG